MNHEGQVALLKQLMAKLDNNEAPDAGCVLKSPTSAYTSASLAEQEWDAFFQGHPQLLGFSGDLPKPRTFITSNDFGVPILATRDAEGRFHAFVNACRHRGAEIASDKRGEKGRFTCPFHNWTYDSDGRLLGVRAQDQFGKIDKSCHGLVELPSEEKYGMLFVHPQVDGRLDVDELLGPELRAEIETWRLGECGHIGDSELDKGLNWKIANDTFGEVYHFNCLHKETVSNIFHGDVHLYDEYGRHHRLCVANKYLSAMRDVPESNWAAVDGSVVVYYLFPNVQIVLFNRVVALIRIFPAHGDIGRSVTKITHYSAHHMAEHVVDEAPVTELSGEDMYAADTSQRIEFNLATQLELFISTVEHEDYVMGEKTQRAVESGKIEHFLFGRNEPALHHFHQNYRDALGMPPLEAAS